VFLLFPREDIGKSIGCFGAVNEFNCIKSAKYSVSLVVTRHDVPVFNAQKVQYSMDTYSSFTTGCTGYIIGVEIEEV
jgi:hypothetical protein